MNKNHKACALSFILPVVMILIINASFVVNQVIAQDIVLSDTTITTEATFSTDNSIIAGPDFTITSSGDVTFRASNGITFLPGVYIIQGGQVHAMTGIAAAIEQEEEVLRPSDFVVHQNYPNPFNPTTQIRYTLPVRGYVKADIYTVFGEKVKTLFSGDQPAGRHSLVWNGTNQFGQKLSSGIYYLQIDAGKYRAVKKMTLLK
jgi:hypothetical protein